MSSAAVAIKCCIIVIIYGPISTLHNKLTFKFGITWSNWQSLWQTETEKHLTSSSSAWQGLLSIPLPGDGRPKGRAWQAIKGQRQGKAGRNITITTTTATIHSSNFPSTTIHREPHCPCLFFVCPEIQRLENSYISVVCDVSFLRPAQMPFGIMHIPLCWEQLSSSIKRA